MARPTPEQLAKINLKCKKEMSADDVYVHSFRLLGTGYIPSRFMQFDISLMDKYLANVNNGDVVQIADHSFGGYSDNVTLPFGRFFEGAIVQDGGKVQLDGTMFMPKNSKTYIGNYTTDDIDQQIDSGILFDSSVSVTWGFSECSICHCDIRDWESCNHWPGKTYEQADGSEVLCYVIAKPAPPPRQDNSMMIENSIVCAGAYPDAGVLSVNANLEHAKEHLDRQLTKLNNIADLKLVNKDAPVFCCLSATSATFQVESENLRDASELHHLYHSMYSDGLPEGWTMAKLTAKHKEAVKELLDAGHDHLMTDALDGTLNEALKAKSTKGSGLIVDEKEKLALETEIGELKQSVTAKDTEVVTLTAKVAELTPLATLGTKYREDAIKVALASGVRNQGNEFKEEVYGKMFANLSIEEIQEMGATWEASALAKLGLPAGHTKPDEFKLPGSATISSNDDGCYKL